MNSVEQLNNFLNRLTSDADLTTSHISIGTALSVVWISNGLTSPFNISRRGLMAAAKIKSITTYHKVIADLVKLNYVIYQPSYHPTKGSLIHIL